MTGLDTNILIRFIVKDDPEQARVAGEHLRAIRSARGKAFINSVVLCEIAWVLSSNYRYPRELVAQAIERILGIRHFEVENRTLVEKALNDFRQGTADFADCLIGRLNTATGCTKTISFDQGIRGLPGLEVL